MIRTALVCVRVCVRERGRTQGFKIHGEIQKYSILDIHHCTTCVVCRLLPSRWRTALQRALSCPGATEVPYAFQFACPICSMWHTVTSFSLAWSTYLTRLCSAKQERKLHEGKSEGTGYSSRLVLGWGRDVRCNFASSADRLTTHLPVLLAEELGTFP